MERPDPRNKDRPLPGAGYHSRDMREAEDMIHLVDTRKAGDTIHLVETRKAGDTIHLVDTAGMGPRQGESRARR